MSRERIAQASTVAVRVSLTARSICTLCMAATPHLPQPLLLDSSWHRHISRSSRSFTASAFKGWKNPVLLELVSEELVIATPSLPKRGSL